MSEAQDFERLKNNLNIIVNDPQEVQKLLELVKKEQELHQQLEGKTLIGEVALSEEEIEQLGEYLYRWFDCFDNPFNRSMLRYVSIRITSPIDGLWDYFPCCAACFTVGVFAHFYDNSYWPHFRRLFINLAASQQQTWHEKFLNFLQKRNMPAFYHIEGQTFLRHVRVHALIARARLRNVFEQVVRPAVEQELDQEELTACEILETVRPDYQLRVPERNFLEEGANIADDFLDRCMSLYRLALQNPNVLAQYQENPENNEFNLPSWVIQEFVEWFRRGERREDAWLGGGASS